MDVAAEVSVPINTTTSIDEITSRFRNPLLADKWWGLTRYFDLDPGDGYLDYECDTVTYDGHDGNDFAIQDFYAQDEGQWIVAAASGVVHGTDDGHFDRHTSQVPGARVNGVTVAHADGTVSYYLHMKKWTVEVAGGQEVFEGQPLGQVGSSGQSTGPHLHYAVWKDGVPYEPHAGACRPGDSLWEDQLPHVTANPVSLIWTGIAVLDPTGEQLERPPEVHHFQQQPGGTTQFFWVYLRDCHVGDDIRTIWRDSTGAVFREKTAYCPAYSARTFRKWITVLPGTGYLGTWTVEFRLNGVTHAEHSFFYDGNPYSDPVAEGRTVIVPHGTAGGGLVGSDADSEIKQFRIVRPPPHGQVSLSGPRQGHFFYVPDAGFAGTDNFRFEVEDAQGQISAPATMTMQVAPIAANTLRLEGEDDHVTVPDNGSLNLNDGFTLEAWIRRARGSGGWDVLFDRRDADNLTGFSFGLMPDARLRLGVGNGSQATFTYGNTPIPLDRWSHVAATWDGATMRVFVDGVEDGIPVAFSGPISYPGTYPTRLGRSLTPGNSFRGEIDEMRIWSVARTPEELRAGAQCDFLEGTAPASLRAWWRFHGDASDSSSFANHGDLVAPASFRNVHGGLPLSCSGMDSDGDGMADASDNCPLTPNFEQTDIDGDGWGDACDLCPELYGREMHDSDLDGLGDACDLCPFLADTDQADGDSDGTGDLCDPDPSDPDQAIPTADIELSLGHDGPTGETTLSWGAEFHAATYMVVRGGLAEIRARFYGTCRNFADADTTDTVFVDDESPAAGELFGYVVIGVNNHGTRGRAGTDTSGKERDFRAKDCL
jgi:hypothetical protein